MVISLSHPIATSKKSVLKEGKADMPYMICWGERLMTVITISALYSF